MVSKWITSAQNAHIKNIRKLRLKAYLRKTSSLFIIEGIQEIELALEGNYVLDSLYICPTLFEKVRIPKMIRFVCTGGTPCYKITKIVFQKISCRDNFNGIVALAKAKVCNLANLHLSENPLILVLESIEKPGNLGAILRTAAAAGLDAVVICNERTDLYNANVIRSSVGCVFIVPIAVATNQETFSYLKRRRIHIVATSLSSSIYYQKTSFISSSAIVMGTESVGLSNFWMKNADKCIKIPIANNVNSLNVSTAAAIITFEAIRQRGGFPFLKLNK